MSFGGGAKKAARIQAAATEKAAAEQSKQMRLQAQAAQQQQESMMARDRALKAAEALQKNQKTQQVEVDTKVNDPNYNVDEMGRKRAPREAFKINRKSQSIKI